MLTGIHGAVVAFRRSADRLLAPMAARPSLRRAAASIPGGGLRVRACNLATLHGIPENGDFEISKGSFRVSRGSSPATAKRGLVAWVGRKVKSTKAHSVND